MTQLTMRIEVDTARAKQLIEELHALLPGLPEHVRDGLAGQLRELSLGRFGVELVPAGGADKSSIRFGVVVPELDEVLAAARRAAEVRDVVHGGSADGVKES